ncbi:MAG: FAD-dependent oxidoreductase [Mycobacterium sp.]
MVTSRVVIVGAGPVGATAALLLAEHGIDSIVVERRTCPSTHPAAHVLSTRTLEIFRELGLEHDVRRLSSRVYELRDAIYATTLTGPELGRVTIYDPDSAEARRLDTLSPTRAANLSQHILVQLLWDRLDLCDRVEFRRGSSYVDHRETADGVSVRVGEGDEPIEGRYLIAADGAGSRVRSGCGFQMPGPVLQHVISVHFSADLRRHLWSRRGPVIFTFTPGGIGITIVHSSPGEFVFQIPYFPPVQRVEDYTADECRRRIHDALGDRTIAVDIHSVQSWAMTAQVATHYRRGRTFLVGDAAHRFPPTGGLGLNTGINDVHNLAWKLAWDVTGSAPAGLLDTYESERRPIGIANTEQSVKNFDGLTEVFRVLGLPRSGMSALQALAGSRVMAALPRHVSRRVFSAAMSAGLRVLVLAASPGRAGKRIRRNAIAAIARQSPNYRTWGLDLGVRYQHGILTSSCDFGGARDVETYTSEIRVGGRVPHAWVTHRGARVSTLDLAARDTLTILTAAKYESRWLAALTALECRLSVAAVDLEAHTEQLSVLTEGKAILLRPDSHIAAVLDPSCSGYAGVLGATIDELGFRPSARGCLESTS